jgi:predicted amidohydrolase YtcJ
MTKTSPKKTADVIFVGAKVQSLDADSHQTEAIAIKDSTILALGSRADMLALKGAETKVHELNGGTILPGLNDAHLHGAWYGATYPKLMFKDHDFDWHGKMIDSEAGREDAILTAWEKLAALGITSYTEPGIGPGEDQGATGCFGTKMFETYARLAGTMAQTARVTMLRLFGLLDGASQLEDYMAGLDTVLPQTDPKWLSVNGVKIFADGIPPMRSAWTLDPYREGGHGELLTGTGSENERLETFRKMIFAAHNRGLQIGVHATGDRTSEAFIQALEEVGADDSLRHYIIHGDLLTPEQLERMAQLGIGIDLQPLIADQTQGWLAGAVSKDVAKRAWPIHLIVKHNWLTLTSDAPVASPDWRHIVVSAAKMLQRHNVPLTNELKIDLLRMYTSVPAYQDFAESWKGTLAPGKVADLCWVSGDVLGDDFMHLPEMPINFTMVGGRIVYGGI